MKYFSSLLIILLFGSNISFGESPKKTLNLNELIADAIISTDKESIVISNAHINTENLKFKFLYEYLENTVEERFFKAEEGKVLIDIPITFKKCSFSSLHFNRLYFKQDITFTDCTFEDELKFTKSNFSEVTIEECKLQSLIIDKCDFSGHLLSEWNRMSNCKIFNSTFKGITKLVNHIEEFIEVNNSMFYPQQFPCTIVHDSIGYGRPIYNNLQLIIANFEAHTIDQVIIRNSSFLSNESINKVAVQADINQLIIEDNSFRSSFDLNKTSIEKRLIIRNNIFHDFIGFNDVIFPELFNIVEWSQFEGFKLCIFEPSPNEIKYACPPNYKKIRRISDLNNILYLAENNNELVNKDSYNLLISIYQRMYNIYKSNGDIKSSNGCYSEMKDVQSRMLKFNFKEKKTFNNFFRWKLAQLLKTYVDHGTDPARAISISVYVILIFAFFYFLFPSDWDITSKSKLMKEFSNYLRHTSKGNTKNFLITVWSLLISFLNAITLSLNAFTTLGFGNIPTKGAARYICIIQGFIGWFLLSIFTVALINQVLG